MTTQTLSIEERLAAMESALAEARAENEALRLRSPTGDPMLEIALDEFAKPYVHPVAGGHMQGPCRATTARGTCGRPWVDHLPDGRNLGNDAAPARIRDHSYRERPPDPPNEKPKGTLYAREMVVAEDGSLEDTYQTEKAAAAALGTTVRKVREMVKAGTLFADTVGGVTLMRRASVERVVALREIARDEPEK